MSWLNDEQLEHLAVSNYEWRYAKQHTMDIDYIKHTEYKEDTTKITLSAHVGANQWYIHNPVVVLNKSADKVLALRCDCFAGRFGQMCTHQIMLIRYMRTLNEIQPLTNRSNLVYLHEEFKKQIRALEKQRALDEKKKQAIQLVDNLRHQVSIQLVDSVAQARDKAYLYVQDISKDKYYDAIYITFKIGIDKLYVVKNMGHLLNEAFDGEKVNYGKFFTLHHNKDEYDEFTMKQIQLYRSFERREATKQLVVVNQSIDDIFQLFFEGDTKYSAFRWLEDENKVKLRLIKKKDEFYKLSLVDKDIEFIYSDLYVYYLNDHALVRMYDPYTKIKREIVFNTYYKAFQHMDKETTFKLIDIFKLYDDLFDVSYGGIERDEKASEELHASMYVDLEEGMLAIKIEAEFDDGEIYNPAIHEMKFSLTTDAIYQYLIQDAQVQEGMILFPLDSEQGEMFLYENMEKYHQHFIVYISDAVRQLAKPKKLSLQAGVKVNNGLLEVDLSQFEYSVKELQEMMKQYRKKKRYHKLTNGDIVDLTQPFFEDFDETMEQLNIHDNDLNKDKIKVPLFRSFSLQDKEGSIVLERQKTYQQLLDQFTTKQAKTSLLPRYEEVLRDYQKEGVQWLMMLREYGFGGILADDMGLGKTLQVIALLESVGFTKHCMIVTPAALMYNWEAEIQKFAPTLPHVCISGNYEQRRQKIESASSPTIFISTYDYVKNDSELYEKMQFEYVILDEAQYIKNHVTKAARSVKELNATYRIALTGTPIENTLAELWSIFDFLMPSYLYNYHYFTSNYERKIVKDQDEKVQVKLKQLVEPFILRRRKQEVLLDLPDKIEKVMKFKFSDNEQKYYLSKLAMYNHELKEQMENTGPINKVVIFSMLTKLRQICCDSRLLDEGTDFQSSKLNGCMSLIETLLESDQSILLFSSFTSMLDLLEAELKERGVTYLRLTGSDSKEARKQLVERFQNGEAPVFLISLKAGGVGLNLTRASAVIHYDPWWNISAQNQATDRAYRIGQNQDVQVFKLIVQDTIEDKILAMQERKQALSDMFVEGSKGSVSSMDLEQLKQLFEN